MFLVSQVRKCGPKAPGFGLRREMKPVMVGFQGRIAEIL
jgi:hypothetical protein